MINIMLLIRSVVFILIYTYSFHLYAVPDKSQLMNEVFIINGEVSNLKGRGENFDSKYTPCSTFATIVTLVAYDLDVFSKDVDRKNSQVPTFKEWSKCIKSQSRNLLSPVNLHCSGYMRSIIKKIGQKQLQHYIDKINYGNKNLSGYNNSENSFISSYNSSSLTISLTEQAKLMEKLALNKLPFSIKSQEELKKIMFIGMEKGKRKRYEMDATCLLSDEKCNPILNRVISWRIGFLQNNSETIGYAGSNISLEDDTDVENGFGSMIDTIIAKGLE